MSEENEINVNGIDKKLDRLVEVTSKLVESNRKTSARMDGLEREMQDLVKQYSILLEDQRRNAKLQFATTELVAVRQELEQKYGDNYNVRKTMVGVLQATDAKIVRQQTIKELTEKLMVTTPNYWLAPCLIAVSAWIGNDKDLAERAIKVAMDMDAEQTAITMALICRRNGRTETCYEWLSVYFSLQTAFKFTDVTFNYVVAYLNGVFGPDEKGKCKDYINKWLTDIKNRRINFDTEQQEEWYNYFENNYKCDVNDSCETLSSICSNYAQIKEYAGRVYSVDRIVSKFRQIEETEIDQTELKRSIDENLLNLVKSYAKDEGPLRREEKRLTLIKHFKGDEEAADRQIEKEEEERMAKVVDMIQQMTNALTDEQASLPNQKMAVGFLGDYINEGFGKYINDNREAFPESAKVKIDDWYGEIRTAEDAERLMQKYESHELSKRDSEIARLSIASQAAYVIGGTACILLTILCLFIATPLAPVFVAGAIVLFIMFAVKYSQNSVIKKEKINTYNEIIASGRQKIATAAGEWEKVRQDINGFTNRYEAGEFSKLCTGVIRDT
ncbi:MAG: hypothetical protein MJ131_04840 [Lachnospiraceae bacterium]|nr:hypothetical protein [Lachnospiraceae bacterium]